MAKEAKISINIDSRKAKRATDELDKSVGGFVDSTKNATTRLREMQNELVNLEPGSEQFKNLAREAGQLQDQINKARAEIRAFSNDTFALQGTVGVIQGVTSAYSSATATMALFGAENEELIQVFARLELIQKSVNGLIATYTAFQRGSAAMTFLQTARTRILNTTKALSNQIDETANRLIGRQTVLTNAQTVATNGATFATRALGMAMKALPIVAIIAGVTALIGAFGSMGDEIEEVNESLDNFKAKADLSETITNIERLRIGYSDIQDELKQIDNLQKSGQITSTEAAKQQADLARQTLRDIEDRNFGLQGEKVGYEELTNAVRIYDRAQAGLSLTFEEMTTGTEILKDAFGVIDKEQVEAARSTIKLYELLNNTIINSNQNIRNENAKTQKQRQDLERKAVEEAIKAEQFRLLKINGLREDAIKEIMDKNSFERQFFGEADPQGRLQAIYNTLSETQRREIVRLADQAVAHLDGAVKARRREVEIWNQLFALDEFRDVVAEQGSIIGTIDAAQNDLAQSYSFLTGIIEDEYNDQLNLLQTRLDKELISQLDFEQELFKLEGDRLKRIEKLDADILKSNTKMNDLRNQAARHQHDLEIRDLELLGDQKEEIAIRQLENRFDEERKKTAELFGRNSEEFKQLVIIQNKELDALQGKLLEERNQYMIQQTAADLRSIREMTNTTAFAMRDAVNGSFEGMRFGFNSLREQLLDPNTGLMAMIESFKDGILKTNQLILAGLELGLNAFDAMITSMTNKLLQKNQKQYEADSEALKSQLANRVISEEQFNDRMQDLEDQKRIKEIQAQRKAFNMEKANNLGLAAINTAQAILQAIAQFGPPPSPAGIAGIAAAGAIGGVQMGLISGQQFQAARGGIVPGQGVGTRDKIPALLAPGEAVINSQSTAMFPELLSAINRIGGGVSLAPTIESSTSSGGGKNEPVKAYVVWNDLKEKMDFNDRDESMNTFR